MKHDRIWAKGENYKLKQRIKENKDKQDRNYPNSFWYNHTVRDARAT